LHARAKGLDGRDDFRKMLEKNRKFTKDSLDPAFGLSNSSQPRKQRPNDKENSGEKSEVETKNGREKKSGSCTPSSYRRSGQRVDAQGEANMNQDKNKNRARLCGGLDFLQFFYPLSDQK
jgi:hypothetical protein